MTGKLDPTDWAILGELQRDGRIALSELGRRVNLSASATTERVRRLESAGVITGYRAEVDLAKVGYAVLTGFGSTTTTIVYSQTLPHRGVSPA